MKIYAAVKHFCWVFLFLCSCNGGDEDLFIPTAKYQAFLLKDFAKADYLVANTQTIKPLCRKLTPEALAFENKIQPGRDFSKLEEDCEKQSLTCEQLELKGILSEDQGWGYLRAPLFSMMDWDQKFPLVPIKINAMFFEVEHLPGWPHVMPCTNIFGLAKASDGVFIGNKTSDFPSDYFVISKKAKYDSNISVIYNRDMTDDIKNNSTAILNGFILVKNGEYVYGKSGQKPSGNFKNVGDCENRYARTAVGFKGKDMYIFTVSNAKRDKFGATCKEVADIAVKKFKVEDLFAFDGGGSSGIFAKNISTNKFIYKTPAWDKQGYRPVPSFLGITPDSMEQFSHIEGNDK